MDWRLKCLGFYVLKFAPRSVYFFLQRHVTGRYLPKITDAVFGALSHHLGNFRGGRALEFGCGDLRTALLLSTRASEVLAYDITRLANVERVNEAIRQLKERLPGFDWPLVENLDTDLERLYRIRYLAPGDARATGLPDRSVDFVCSTSVLEHVPRADIEAILRECGRILAPRGTMSFWIDCHDHYSTADPRIPMFNFYRYSDVAWRLLNPSTQYQNRLRHSDFTRLFASFKIVEERTIPSAGTWVSLAPRFARYSTEELRARNGIFLLARP